jgi:ERCC4-type nuclease
MYDKELMPVVDDLYLNDQSMVLLSMKQEGRQEELNGIFEDYINQIENSLSTRVQSHYEIPVKQDYCLLPFNANADEEEDLIQDEDEEAQAVEIKPMVKREALRDHQFSEVILIVDNREKRNQNDGSYLFDRLKKNGVNAELRSLPLGDFLWVLRVYNENVMQAPKGTKESKKKAKQLPAFTEYCLDFIVERKTADDLAASIMDGRYDEQKFRLKSCGINNVIYLVEGSPGQYCKIPETVLKKA